MKVLAVLGTLGSGKSTFINRLLPHLIPKGKVLTIVNDVGEVNIDALRISHVGEMEVKALTAGCVGCSDLPAFKEAVMDADRLGIDFLVIEPTGLADGREIKQAVTSCQLNCQTLTLVDVEHFGRNSSLETLPTQIQTANTVLTTWETGGDLPLEVAAYIAKHAPGVSVRSLRALENSEVLGVFVADLLGDSNAATARASWHYRLRASLAVWRRSRREHNHHDHIHPYNVVMNPETVFQDLIEVMVPFRPKLLRAKGVVAGRDFDFVQGDFKIGQPNPASAHGLFIFSERLPAEALESIARPDGRADDRSKKERFRSGRDIPLENTLSAINWALEQYPPVVSPTGLLRVEYEADVAYQLAFRPGVPGHVRREVLHKYLMWRIKAGREIRSGKWHNHPQLPYWQRRVGMNLAWHIQTRGSEIGPELIETALNLYPARMTLEGLAGLQKLSFEEEMAEERPEIIKVVIEFGRQYGGIDIDRTKATLHHCLDLSASNPIWAERWKKVIVELGY